jgi:plasmid maintenance system killer protein
MKVFYSNKKLLTMCTELQKAQKKYNKNAAETLFKRVEQLENAPRLESLRGIGKLEQLRHVENLFSMRLDMQFRLEFKCANEPIGRLPDGSIDWSKVTEIEIMRISDHYG